MVQTYQMTATSAGFDGLWLSLTLVLTLLLVIGVLAYAFARRLRRTLQVSAVAAHLTKAQEDARLEALHDVRGDCVLITKADGSIVEANSAFASFAGVPTAALIGRPVPLRVVSREEKRIEATGCLWVEEALETPRGIRWMEWCETPLKMGAKERSDTLRVGRDITARRSTETDLHEARARAEAANEAKSRFLATVTHEIRTPLSGVLGMSDLLLDTSLTPEQRTYVAAIQTSGKALLGLIDEILDFSKIEAGHLDVNSGAFELTALVESVVELLAPRAQDKGLEIASVVMPGTPTRLLGDAARLRQVLLNLAGNALKFTEKGGVGIRAQAMPDQRLVIAITDTGIGMSEEAAARIFQEFVQVDESASRRHSGTGLGLAISKKLIERMGGTITVESEVGKGSVFAVDIPLTLSGESESPMPQQQGRRILLCGTTPFELPFIAARLTAVGAIVMRAESVESARLALAQSPWDTVIADGALGTTALQLVAEMARSRGARRLIVLTSPFERRDLGTPASAGFDAYLVKPVRQASLFAQLMPESAPLAMPETVLRAASTTALSLDAPAQENAAEKQIHVLLAEDDSVNALLAKTLLAKQGAKVTHVDNGHDAIKALEASMRLEAPLIHLVLMDMRMPGLDGLETTRQLRALEEKQGAVHTPVFALTANAFAEDREACMQAGMDGFLTKPLDRDRLRAVLASAHLSAQPANEYKL
jgi:PAS domain S-box-containing protein